MTKKLKIIIASIAASVCLAGGLIWGIIALVGDNRNKADIVCTTFAAYDWTREILGAEAGNYNIRYLMSSGVDFHSFNPSAADIVQIKTCKLLIYVGGESDEWLHKVLEEDTNPNMRTVALLEVIEEAEKALKEEYKEGMQEEHEHEHEHEEEEEEESEEEFDEHVWLSLKNAQLCVSAIVEALCEIYPDKADAFNVKADSYKVKLDDLDEKYTAAVVAGSKKVLLFGDRFPFLYLAKDYGLDYWAAFIGCSAETEATAGTVTFLKDKVGSLSIDVILVIETSDKKIAATIKDETSATQILVMHSCQSVTAKALPTTTYLSIMTGNLAVLIEALK
jgi:zinc transport system substrate-binding protein